jgi:uncharacterized membrane protein YhhN
MKKSGITLVYFIIGFFQVILQNHASPYFEHITKALIIPVLMILFIQNIDLFKNRLHIFLFAGLFFSWAGDIILEIPDNSGQFFVVGLACFLIAHIMYLTVFLATPGINYIRLNRIWVLLPVIVYGIVLVSFLYKDLDKMRLPVIIYAIVILMMLSGAINRKQKVNKKSYWIVLGGAVLFLISDSAIAVNKFSYNFEYSGIVIMSTYIIAQYLIVTGYLAQFKGSNTNQMSR